MSSLDLTMERVLALAREAGTPAAAEARDLVAAHLEGLGYQVNRQRFAFAPSSLNGFPIFGAGLGGWRCCSCRCSPANGRPAGARPWCSPEGCCCSRCWPSGSASAGSRWAVATREDANLIATRGGVPVRRWIVAHLDTKAQTQSMAGRLVAVWVIGMAVAALAALVARAPRRPRAGAAGGRWGRGGGRWRAALAAADGSRGVAGSARQRDRRGRGAGRGGTAGRIPAPAS